VRVLVVGAGVIGVTTAYALARRGHDVTVLDRRGEVGEETSRANGGQLSASHTDPWPSPANLVRVLTWIGKPDAPLRISLTTDMRQYDWLCRFVANCRPGREQINTEKMLRVALYSRAKLADIQREYNIAFDQKNAGILHIFRSRPAFDRAARQAEVVNALGCERLPVTARRCVEIEPALASVEQELVGGFYCPQDSSGDAHRFTVGLAKICRSMGVEFEFDVSVAAITSTPGSVVRLETTLGPRTADTYVLAAGSYTPLLAETASLTLPVYPAKGYSVTLSLNDLQAGPEISLIDDEKKLVYSRLGGELRVAGTAELGGYNLDINEVRCQQILDSAMGLFSGNIDRRSAVFWTGLRPQTPDSVPVIGPTPFQNLYLNTGHGTLGWTMAAGSAEVIGDLVSGKAPDIDPDGLAMDRFLQWPKMFYRIGGVST